MNLLLYAALLACPGPVAHVVAFTYEGPLEIDMCLQHASYDGDILSVYAYDGASDGIFHNGFDP